MDEGSRNELPLTTTVSTYCNSANGNTSTCAPKDIDALPFQNETEATTLTDYSGRKEISVAENSSGFGSFAPSDVDDNCIDHTCSGRNPFNCNECEQPCEDDTELSNHTCNIKPENTRFSCGICGEKFAKKWQCSAHLKVHRDQLLVNKEEVPLCAGKFPCEVCGRVFKTNRRVREHKRIHTGDKPFKCDVCDKSFNRQDRLKIHMRYHTGERPYQCPHCEKSFAENSTLFRHIATHDKTEETPFTCDQCPRSFRRKFQLLAHMSAHQCQKKNKCSECDKCFPAPSLLKEHMRVHSGEKPFFCPVCSKSFRNMAHVKRHMITHTKPKPFQCVECDRSFGLQDRLDNHIRRTGHTGKNQFACPHCKRTFKKQSNYSSHMKSHMNNEGDLSATDHEEDVIIEEIQSSTNVLSSESQLTEMMESDADSQNDPIIQVLICTDETPDVIENNLSTDLDDRNPVTDSGTTDEPQNCHNLTANYDTDLSTVVILLPNSLDDGTLAEPSEDIQTDVLGDCELYECEDPS